MPRELRYWWAGLACLLGCVPSLFAGPVRRGWIYEQLSPAPCPTGKGQSRYQATFAGTNLGDSLSLLGEAVLDLRELEVVVKGSQRFYPAVSDQGAALKNALSDEHQSLSIEVGRYLVTKTMHYGRVGIGVLRFLPISSHFVKLGIQGGIMDTPQNPWSLRLDTSVYLNLPHDYNYLMVMGETTKVALSGNSHSLLVGVFLNWGYRLADVNNVGTYEHMLFSLGPSLTWRSPWGNLRATIPCRLWLDKELFPDPASSSVPPGNLTGYPSEFGPDLSVTWTLVF